MASRADVKSLLIQIDATTTLLRSQLATAERDVGEFQRDTSRQLAKVDRDFAGLGKSVSKLSTSLNFLKGAAAGFIASVGVSTFTSLIRDTLDFADALGEMSEKLGVSNEFLQAFRLQVADAGGTITGADTALEKFSKTFGEALVGSARGVETFKSLGVQLRDAEGRARPLEAVFSDVADAIARLPSEAERAAAGAKLFGRQWSDVALTVQAGGKAFAQAAEEAKQYGLVLSEDEIRNAGKIAAQLEKLKNVLSVKIASVIIENADAIIKLAKALGDVTIAAVKAGAALVDWMTRTRQAKKAGDEVIAEAPWGLGTIYRSRPQPKQAPARGGAGGAIGTAGTLVTSSIGTDVIDELMSQIEADMRGAVDVAEAARRTAGDFLDVQAGLATTAKERRDVELEMLDLAKQSERQQNELILALTTSTEAEKEIARQRLASLDTLYEARKASVEKRTQGPLGQKLEAFSAKSLDTELEQVAAGGIDSVVEGLADIVSGSKKAKDAFNDMIDGLLKDLARLAVKQALKGIAGALFGASDDTGGGGLFGSFFKSIFGGGRATGGPVEAGRAYVVGERRPEIFVPRVSGTVLAGVQAGGGPTFVQTINAPGATAETVAMIRRELRNAAPSIIAASRDATLAASSRPRLS